jgi:hypothetical protein
MARVLSIVVNLRVKNLQNDHVDNQKYIIISACAVVIEIRSSIDTTLTRMCTESDLPKILTLLVVSSLKFIARLKIELKRITNISYLPSHFQTGLQNNGIAK